MATFFVVGSRVIEYPDVLREEYMSGHEISVHTWSHPVRILGIVMSYALSNWAIVSHNPHQRGNRSRIRLDS